jgi:hypothetical protein
MTRGEAIATVEKHRRGFHGDLTQVLVDVLEALGLLHLETTEDKVRIAAAERLTLAHTLVVGPTATERAANITRDGAFEIIDVLTKSGFRITKDD